MTHATLRQETKKRPAATCANGPRNNTIMIAPQARSVKPCAALGWISWLIMLGVVGGMDTGRIGVCAGILCSFGLLAAGALFLRKAGWLK